MTNKIGTGVVRRFKPIFVHIFALHCNKNFEDLKAEYGLNIHAYIYIYLFIYAPPVYISYALTANLEACSINKPLALKILYKRPGVY